MGRFFVNDLHDEFAGWLLGEGDGGHCEMGNRSLANLRMLDWLDATLAEGGQA